MATVEYIIGADYITGKGWGTYAICVGTNLIKTDRIQCESITEFKSRLRSIAKALNGNVEILMEQN